MNDNLAFFIIIAVATFIVVFSIFYGILHERRKRMAVKPTWTTHIAMLSGQPFVQSSDIELHDKRQEELFNLAYAVGSVHSITKKTPAGETVNEQLTISRIRRSLRAGSPKAKLGLTAYFSEYEGSEFPVTYAVAGTKKIVSLHLDSENVTATDVNAEVVWQSTWAALCFANARELLVYDVSARENGVELDYTNADPELEALMIKYATLNPRARV